MSKPTYSRRQLLGFAGKLTIGIGVGVVTATLLPACVSDGDDRMTSKNPDPRADNYY